MPANNNFLSTLTPTASGKHERPGGMMYIHRKSRVTVIRLEKSPPPEMTMVVLVLWVIVPAIAFLLFVKTPLILPSLSVFSLVAAALVALTAWTTRARREERHITLWDVSGAYALVGFAAGMVSDPTQVLELMALPTGPSTGAP
jgi:hypothetical protein